MKIVLAPFIFLYKLYFGIIFFSSFIALYPFFLLLVSTPKWHPAAFRLKRGWSFALQVLLFIPLSKRTEAALPNEPYIICSNHASYLDIILMYSVFSNRFIFMGKHELLKWPLLGLFFKKEMDIAVNRTNKIEAVKSLIKVGNKLEDGWSVVIFPEGTMPQHAPQLLEFKNGAFSLAIKKQVPIVPVTFLTNWKLFSDHAQVFQRGRPGVSKVIIHAPIETKGMTEQDLVPLREQVFNTINNALKLYENR